nr:hypothetical protein [Tanacetum cinerariifolium]
DGGEGCGMSTQEYMKKFIENVVEDFKSGTVVKVFRKDTVSGSGSGMLMEEEVVKLMEEEDMDDLKLQDGGEGCGIDIKNFLKNGKLDQVVTVVKSCSSNVTHDLTVTLKDLSGVALILANVSVFTHKPSMHYLNIIMRSMVKVFRKDTVSGSGSGMLMEEEVVKLMEEEEMDDLKLQV